MEWQDSTIKSILQNEKYRGSALLQKHFTTDFLTKKQKVNEGEVPRYYIEHSHEAIIDPLEWDAVQEEIKRRKLIGNAYSGKSVFSAKLVCGDCGSRYGSKLWHSTDKYKTTVWQCNDKYNNRCKCKTPTLTENEIRERFITVFNSIISSKEPYLEACVAAKNALTDTAALDAKLDNIRQEMEIVAGIIRKCIEENSSTALDQDEYNTRYNGYVGRYEAAKRQFDRLSNERQNKIAKAKAIDRFIHTVRSRDGLLKEFDPHLWIATVEEVTVTRDGKMLFRFFDGTEVME
ncbi:MAG: recombinase family protein [Clostridiales bacterium]|nr:recombinase family protein [Clostridiales bacterium]